MTINQIVEECAWKLLLKNNISTTRQDAITGGESHPLYKCIMGCEGYDKDCIGYKILKINRDKYMRINH